MKEENKKVGLLISQFIIIGFLFTNIYLITTKTALAPQIMAGISFIIFAGLLFMTVKKGQHLEKTQD